MTFAQTKTQINRYVKQKKWYWYAPVWLIGIYIFFAILRFHPNQQPPLIILPAQSIDFALHEFAHILTSFLPSLITAAAGSFSELILGGLLIYGAFKTRSYFASLICFLWFMLTCQSAGIYMADARAQEMNLVSLGGALAGSETVIHDWNFIFGKLNLLGLDTLIGNTVRGIGILAGLIGLAFTAWLMYKMARRGGSQTPNDKESDLLQAARVSAGISRDENHSSSLR